MEGVSAEKNGRDCAQTPGTFPTTSLFTKLPHELQHQVVEDAAAQRVTEWLRWCADPNLHPESPSSQLPSILDLILVNRDWTQITVSWLTRTPLFLDLSMHGMNIPWAGFQTMMKVGGLHRCKRMKIRWSIPGTELSGWLLQWWEKHFEFRDHFYHIYRDCHTATPDMGWLLGQRKILHHPAAVSWTCGDDDDDEMRDDVWHMWVGLGLADWQNKRDEKHRMNCEMTLPVVLDEIAHQQGKLSAPDATKFITYRIFLMAVGLDMGNKSIKVFQGIQGHLDHN